MPSVNGPEGPPETEQTEREPLTLARAKLFADTTVHRVSGSAAFVFDAGFVHHFAAGEALDRAGFTGPQVVGRRPHELMPADEWTRVRPLYTRALRERFTADHRAGDGRAYRIHGSPIVGASGVSEGGVLIVHESVSSVNDELVRRLQQQSAIAELGSIALGGDVGFDDLVELASRFLDKAFGRQGAGVMQVLADSDEIRVVFETSGSLTGLQVPLTGSVTELVLTAGRALVVDAPAQAIHPSTTERVGGAVRSLICAPISDRTSAFGIIAAYSTEDGDFSDSDLYFVAAIANILGEALREEQADEQLRRLSLYDSVTGLPNRPLLQDRLALALATGRQLGRSVGVLFLDLDRFKYVNDAIGHAAADDVLRTVASRFQAVLGDADTLARFGGDEFVAVLAGIDGASDAVAVVRALQSSLNASIGVGLHEIRVHASAGVLVCSPRDDITPDEAIRNASAAMHMAKRRGVGRHELAGSAAVGAARARRELPHELRTALAERQWRVALQPFVSLDDGSAIGAEALVRWQHPMKGLIGPAHFMDVAEETGLIVPIGDFVLREACRRAVSSAKVMDGDFLLTVNLSPTQLSAVGIVDAVWNALAASRFPAGMLGIEVTEGALIADEGQVRETLEALNALGVKVLLDDFGTGYSSLSHLKQFAIDCVKIDRSFVSGLGEPESDDEAIVAAIIAMAHATGKKVIGEGVETHAQRRHLKRLGCDYAQGYLFARPLAPPDFEQWLRELRG